MRELGGSLASACAIIIGRGPTQGSSRGREGRREARQVGIKRSNVGTAEMSRTKEIFLHQSTLYKDDIKKKQKKNVEDTLI